MRTRLFCIAALLAGVSVARAEDDPHQLYDRGVAAYDAGAFAEATALFQRAYAASNAPDLLFNIAQAYRKWGRCADALAFYRRYLDEAPNPTNRKEVDERIAEMQTCATERPATPEPPAPEPVKPAPKPEPTPPRPVETDDPGSTHRRVALVLALSGGAVGLAGGGIYWRARVKFDEARDICPCAPGTYAGWERATTASYIMMGVGGAALAGSVVLYLVAPARETPVQVVATPRGVGIAGTF